MLSEAEIYSSKYLRHAPYKKIDAAALSPEDAVRLRLKRSKNKYAAEKSRQKKQYTLMRLQGECDQEATVHESLSSEIQLLRNQKEHLEYLFLLHKPHCKLSTTDDRQQPQSEEEKAVASINTYIPNTVSKYIPTVTEYISTPIYDNGEAPVLTQL
jgi:hypothetical protein